MERRILYEELRLIERSESEVSAAWKGAHLLLFFLAFVFGSFCTFCFHILMYLFDEKCVLFPKLLSLNSLRHSTIYGFLPEENAKSEPLPVDFLSTQFIHKSACYLPTYLPLVSGIFGLVWTTMFLMCSSGSRSLSGLQRPWRVVPPVLVFSLIMSSLCIYSSAVTHYGLQDLCKKLGGITGSNSNTCSYSINVATLAFERQIRGVYQATRLTITSAWLHTACWLASAALAIVRILLAVDFRLVKIRAEVVGNMDRMLERNEEYMQTVMPNRWPDADSDFTAGSQVYSYFNTDHYDTVQEYGKLLDVGSDVLFVSNQYVPPSEQALLLEERNKSSRIIAYESAPMEHRFIVNLLYDMLDSVAQESSSSSVEVDSTETITRQYGQQNLSYKIPPSYENRTMAKAKEIFRSSKSAEIYELPLRSSEASDLTLSTSKKRDFASDSSIKTSEMQQMQQSINDEGLSVESSKKVKSLGEPNIQKSNLKAYVKDAAVQTEAKNKATKKYNVTIADDTDVSDKNDDDSSSDSKKDEKTQTKPKEKQD